MKETSSQMSALIANITRCTILQPCAEVMTSNNHLRTPDRGGKLRHGV